MKRAVAEAPVLFLVSARWNTARESSTRRLIEESLALGCPTHVAVVDTVIADGRRIGVRAYRVRAVIAGRSVLAGPKAVAVQSFPVVWLRPSPPFDLAQVNALRLLSGSGPRSNTRFINPPDVLLRWTSKTILLPLAGRESPVSIVSADRFALERFTRTRPAFVKQLHRAEGRGVARVERGDPMRLVERYSHGFREHVLLQDAVDRTDHTRVWMIDGKPIAVGAIFDGQLVRPHTLGGKLAQHARRVGKHLRAVGVSFAAVDFVGNKAIEANICRPGLIAEYERASGANLARSLVQRSLR